MSSDDSSHPIETRQSKNKMEETGWTHGRASKDATGSRQLILPRPLHAATSTWPFDTSVLDVDGHGIAVTDVGNGRVLVFVHTGFWSFIWRDVMLRLRDDFRCICFDAPGAGWSQRLSVADISLDRAARALTAIIEILNLENVTLVLHDLGGPSGMAGAAPVANRIKAVCIVNAFAWRPSGTLFRGMLGLIGNPVVREFDVLTGGLLPAITATSFGIGRRFDRPSRKAFLSGIGREGIRTFHAYMRDALKSEHIYDQIQQVLAGPFSQLPVCTIFGEKNDPLNFQRRWRELFPNARQVVVSRGNHFPMCDDPDLVAACIRDLVRDVMPTHAASH
jgi:pimeloyl-ACP methyl ester carboxylesterase